MSIRRWSWLIVGIFVLGGAVGIWIANPFAASSVSRAERANGEPKAPDFTLETVSGETFRLQDHSGSVVVLNFWATWCPPCRREIPDFVSLQRELGDDGLQFVGVALEREAGPAKVRAFAEEMGINYPVGISDGAIAKRYGGVRGLPMTFVIGRDGRIRETIQGIATEDRIRPVLEPLLDESS